MNPPLLRLEVSELVFDDDCQTRAALSEDAVADYAEAYRLQAAADFAGTRIPPLRVFVVDGRHVLIDGYHRAAGALRAGQLTLPVEVVGHGTMDLARWTALKMNHLHGLRRSNADKRRAVELALRSPIGIEAPTRTIAGQTGVSHDLVARVRAEWEAAREAEEAARVCAEGAAYEASRQPPPKPKANGRPAPKGVEAPTLDPLPAQIVHGEPSEAAPVPIGDFDRLNQALADAAKAIDAARRKVRAIGEVRSTGRGKGGAEGHRGPPESHRRLADPRMVGEVDEELQALASRLRGAQVGACPACEGAGCGTCRDRGWVYQRDRRTAALSS